MGRPQIERHKIKTSITIDPELYSWVQSKVETKEFSNLTHAIERGLILLREKLEEKKH
jgi:Arc/MetJ-type ribon-helix-helix transcriptional regulator